MGTMFCSKGGATGGAPMGWCRAAPLAIVGGASTLRDVRSTMLSTVTFHWDISIQAGDVQRGGDMDPCGLKVSTATDPISKDTRNHEICSKFNRCI